MTTRDIFDFTGGITALVVFVVSFFWFYYDTGAFWGCIAAAALTAGLVWMTYVIIRWMYLAAK